MGEKEDKGAAAQGRTSHARGPVAFVGSKEGFVHRPRWARAGETGFDKGRGSDGIGRAGELVVRDKFRHPPQVPLVNTESRFKRFLIHV